MSADDKTQLEEMLSAYLDGELSAHDQEEIERLLDRDADARRLLNDFRAASGALRALSRRGAPPELVEDLARMSERRALLGDVPRSVLMPREGRRSLYSMLSAAAVIVIAVGGGLWTISMLEDRDTSSPSGQQFALAPQEKAVPAPPLGRRAGVTPASPHQDRGGLVLSGGDGDAEAEVDSLDGALMADASVSPAVPTMPADDRAGASEDETSDARGRARRSKPMRSLASPILRDSAVARHPLRPVEEESLPAPGFISEAAADDGAFVQKTEATREAKQRVAEDGAFELVVACATVADVDELGRKLDRFLARHPLETKAIMPAYGPGVAKRQSAPERRPSGLMIEKKREQSGSTLQRERIVTVRRSELDALLTVLQGDAAAPRTVSLAAGNVVLESRRDILRTMVRGVSEPTTDVDPANVPQKPGPSTEPLVVAMQGLLAPFVRLGEAITDGTSATRDASAAPRRSQPADLRPEPAPVTIAAGREPDETNAPAEEKLDLTIRNAYRAPSREAERRTDEAEGVVAGRVAGQPTIVAEPAVEDAEPQAAPGRLVQRISANLRKGRAGRAAPPTEPQPANAAAPGVTATSIGTSPAVKTRAAKKRPTRADDDVVTVRIRWRVEAAPAEVDTK